MAKSEFLKSSALTTAVLSCGLALPLMGIAYEVAAAPDAALEEIIVTAQKRTERLQDVPIAIGAVTADQAARLGVTDVYSLQLAVPSLVMNHTANEGNIFIRGVGTNLFGPSSEQTVAVYVDGIYYASPEANMFSFNNIERIEVLKGPQGTLFGRNTTGGVVHIITKEPSDEFSGEASIGYANYDTITGSLYVTGGITENLSADIAAMYENQGNGWGKNFTTDLDNGVMADDNFAIRSKFKFTPNDGTRILLAADYSHSKVKYDYQLLPGIVGVDGVSTYPGEYNAVGGLNDIERVNQGGVSLQIEQDVGDMQIVSMTSYRENDVNYVLDQDDTPAAAGNLLLPSTTRSWSQELQLHSADDSRIDWVIGGFYFNTKAAYDPAADVADGFVIIEDSQKSESFAGFGQATAEIVKDTNLTVGLRYTSEKQDLAISRFIVAGGSIPLPNDSQKFEKLTYRFALDHRISEDVLGYASYNRGFKSGGYNLLAPNTAPFKPEVLDAYEVGLKSEWFDRRLRINAAAFIYEYKNIQVTIPQQGGTITVNAARARIKGIEADFQAIPVENLTIAGGISYLDGNYTSYPNALAIGPNGESTDINGDPLTIDATGNRTIASPKWTGSVSLSYLLQTEIGNFEPTVNASYNDGFFFYADNRLTQPSYWLLNAAISWTPTNENFEVQLWAKNLTDSTYYRGRSEQAGLGDAQRQAAPRTYGIKFRSFF